MRKITQEAIEAFYNNTSFNKDNTEVKAYNNGIHKGEVYLFLHGNIIAKKHKGILSITNSGWQTNTTKERLNGLPNVNIYQRAGQWYLNGSPWNGEWIGIV